MLWLPTFTLCKTVPYHAMLAVGSRVYDRPKRHSCQRGSHRGLHVCEHAALSIGSILMDALLCLGLTTRLVLQVLKGQHKFRYKPFEWLYEGLKPLLLHTVLERREATPLTLAVLYCSVGLRLGIPLLPQRVPPPATGEACAHASGAGLDVVADSRCVAWQRVQGAAGAETWVRVSDQVMRP